MRKPYDPEILAIGPYHYGNDKFKFMEEQKLRYLQQLLDRRKESVDRYMPTLREMEHRTRNCYAKTVDLSQEKFLAMMLIDGCFIIELFRKFIVETPMETPMETPVDEDDPLMHELGIHNSIMRDLLLLENQLPLFVLSKLYDLTKDPGDQTEFSLHASMYFGVENRTIGEETEHLLHLYHTWHTSDLPKPNRPDCLPELLRPASTPVKFSATELRESGVRFRAAKGDKLSDIKFENGTLEIPVFKVEDHTESKLRNLVAYEQHRQRRGINYFTDYVIFMDSLINSSKDVKVLRYEGIIKNNLGDDKVVAQTFNRIGDYVAVSGSYYSEIFKNLNAHCYKRWNIWMAKLRREYFHSPWSFLSVLAAIVLLLLTAAQTTFTILPCTK